jgi:hypothetical protein
MQESKNQREEQSNTMFVLYVQLIGYVIWACDTILTMDEKINRHGSVLLRKN